MRTDSDRCYALVPIKRRVLCKSRLAVALGEPERLGLVRFMLARVLAALGEAACVEQVAVVSAERDTVPAHIMVLPDAGGGLNAALARAQRVLLARGADAILVLPADLPCIGAQDVEALVRTGRDGGFALAPDIDGGGTNGLYWSVEAARTRAPAARPGAVAAEPWRFEFGPGSRQRHQAQARRLGLNAGVVRRAGLALDVDSVEDLVRLQQLGELRPELAELCASRYDAGRTAQHV